MLNDWVVPVSDVDRSVWSQLHIDRAEGGWFDLMTSGCSIETNPEPCSLTMKPHDAVAAEVVGDQAPLPVIGQMSSVDDFEAAVLGLPGLRPRRKRGAP